MSDSVQDNRFQLEVPAELAVIVQDAANARGQTVRDFVLAALEDSARAVLPDQRVTQVSDRDRDRVLALLDDAEAQPGPNLLRAPG